MKLTVSCKTCGKVISLSEKDDVSDSDIASAENSSACETDGPFQEFDDNGDPIPMDFSNIIAVKTL